ncbi:MAG: hypothetical protein KGI41_03530, partial [Patescibacteria group bacterium]|nr:hypothetical protein [Patescibacteria group bacterium]
MAKVASQVLRDLRTDKKEELDIEAFVDKVRDVIERAFRCYGSHGGTGEERVGVCVIVQKVGGRLLAAGRSPVEARLE